MDKYLLLINADHPFSESMQKKFKYIYLNDIDGNDTFLEEETFDAFWGLRTYLRSWGINATIRSAGRTLKQQEETFGEIVDEYIVKGFSREGANAYAERQVAKPGFSEHHTGLAIDIKLEPRFITKETPKPLKKIIKRLTTKSMRFIMNKNLAKFGFVKRYDKKKKDITKCQMDEPWHIRYVGVENAKQMRKKDLCLEEFVALKEKSEVPKNETELVK